MSISIVMISLLVTFGLTTTSAQAEERLPFRATFSGTFVKTQFDTNGDEAPANLNFLEGKVIWGFLHIPPQGYISAIRPSNENECLNITR
jgi:hypothetical protein